MSEWMTIESAPKDGRLVRLKCESHPEWHVTTMSWNGKTDRWEGFEFAVMRSVPTWWDKTVDQPTHWQPLPEPQESKP